MRENIYPHANTVVCIEDSKMLKRFQYEILYNADGLDATMAALNDMDYFHKHTDSDARNYDSAIDSLMKATLALAKEIAPDELIWRIFTLYYDIHNMKLVVKEKILEKRLDALAVKYGSYALPTIRSAAVRESDNILQNETLTKGFFEALRANDIYDVDFILDRIYFQTLRKFAEDLGIPKIVEFVIERIDLFNISVFTQSLVVGFPEGYFAKAFSNHGSLPLSKWQKYIDGGIIEAEKFGLLQKYSSVFGKIDNRAKQLSEFDVLIDNYLISKTKVCKLMAFGIEPICAYFYNKLMEIKNIRILLAGKDHGYDIVEIKKRMRIPYEL